MDTFTQTRRDLEALAGFLRVAGHVLEVPEHVWAAMHRIAPLALARAATSKE